MATNQSQAVRRGGPQQQLQRLPRHFRTRNGRGLLLALALSSPAAAQTSAFTDQATGIQLQRFYDARTNFGFGIALPTSPSNSLIGQLSFPLVNGAGWGGLSLTGDGEEQTLLAAWPDGRGNVVSTLRRGPNAAGNSPEVAGSVSVRPIVSATSANNTFLTFTFLCEGCLEDPLSLGAVQSASLAEMGWKLATIPVQNADSSDGVLSPPDAGSGDFSADLAAAKNEKFDSWATMAVDSPTLIEAAPVSDLKARSRNERSDSTRHRRRSSTKTRTRRQRGGFNTDSDFSDGLTSDGISDFSNDDGFTSDDSPFGRVGGAGAARTGSARTGVAKTSKHSSAVTKNRVRRQQGGGRGGFNTDTDGLTDGLTDDDGFSSDDNFVGARPGGPVAAGNRRVNSRRVAGVSAASVKTRARRQAAGSRGGFNTDTDGLTDNQTDGLTDNTDNDGFSSDENARGRGSNNNRVGKRSTGAFARRQTKSLVSRQSGGRNRSGFNTDTDGLSDGLSDNSNNGGFTSDDNGFSTDDNRPRARVGVVARAKKRVTGVAAAGAPKDLARRQVRGGSNTDTDGFTDNDNTDGFSTDENRARVGNARVRVGSVPRTGARRTGVATTDPTRRLARRQTGSGRNGFNTDSDGQTDFFTANETDGFSTDDNLDRTRGGRNRGVQARETTSTATTSAAKRGTFVGGGAVIARR